jgi:6-phosphogluconolactonase
LILYAGSYTEMITGNFGGHGEGIYCFDFDPDNGKLQLKHVHPDTNPSYLCIPSTKFLYTHTEVLESKKPRVQAFKIDIKNFSLELINEQEIPGGFPCHINFSIKNNCILVACYETGNTIIYPIAKDGKLLPHVKVLQHEGKSVNKKRQERAHAHAVVVDDIFNNIMVTDLGLDKIMVYQLDTTNEKFKTKLKQTVSLPPGSGPRHIGVHPDTKHLFVLNELTGTVTIMIYSNGELEPLSTYPALPKEFKEPASAAAIRISANGKFIYTSERTDDCISVLRFDSNNEMFEIIGRQKTMGKTPRDINLDPTGNWLLAANQDSDSIAVFEVNKKNGMINPAHVVENIKSPVCLEWLPLNKIK